MASRDDGFALSVGVSQPPAAPGDLPGLGKLRTKRISSEALPGYFAP
jgi:hypothetical protein